MANNRMWLVHKVSGEKFLLAKYYPSTGWFCKHDETTAKLNEFFDVNDLHSDIGDEYRLEYEDERQSRDA